MQRPIWNEKTDDKAMLLFRQQKLLFAIAKKQEGSDISVIFCNGMESDYDADEYKMPFFHLYFKILQLIPHL